MTIKGESVTVQIPAITYDADTKDEVITWAEVALDNVLFGKPTTEQSEEVMRLYSTQFEYTLGIPKTYTASLANCRVVRDRDSLTYEILGNPQPLPIELCPTSWNREAYARVIDG